MKKNSEFQKTMEEHLIKFKEENQYLPSTNTKRKWQYYDIAYNFYPPIRHAFLQYAYDNAIPLHDFIDHVRSSQAFAINLFFPLLKNEPTKILNVFGNAVKSKLVKIIDYHFEYSLGSNLLGEWKSETRPDEYVTVCDLLIVCQDIQGKKHGFIIEVKFTEPCFSKCGGFTSKGNDINNSIKNVCKSRKELFNDYKSCYLHQRTRGKSARRYLEYFLDLDKAFPYMTEVRECPFKDNNQCIRNHALARALKSTGLVDYSYFVLVCHDNNKEIKTEWNLYYNMASEELRKELVLINASEFIKASSCDTLKKYCKDRYKIN